MNIIGNVSLKISKLELLELKKSLVNKIFKELKLEQFNTNEYIIDKWASEVTIINFCNFGKIL